MAFAIVRQLLEPAYWGRKIMTADTGHGHGSDTGTMDMKEHLRTWHGFVTFMKWMCIGCGGVLVFLAIFRTHG
jgi:hypothetical protein